MQQKLGKEANATCDG